MFKKVTVLALSGVVASTFALAPISNHASAAGLPTKADEYQGGGTAYTYDIDTYYSYYDPANTTPDYAALAALTGLGAAYAQIPSKAAKALAFLGIGIEFFEGIEEFRVTRYVYKLDEPTSTSAGYVIYKSVNEDGETHWSPRYNIGKNGI
jgi:hypothetical protein